MVKTATTRREITLVVENGNWGGVSLRAIRAVLESAYAALAEAFEKEPEDAIHLMPWNQEPPLVVYGRRPYLMYLSARDTYWSLYVYQFSRELCRVLINFDRAGRRRHRWFEEILCELSSLFVLRRLAETWAENPPAGVFEATDFAPYHAEYAEYLAAKHEKFSGAELSEWLAGNIRTPGEDSVKPEPARAAALALLDYFLHDPSLWRECGWLNRWNTEAEETFLDYLDSWSRCLGKNGLDGRMPNLVKKSFCRYETASSRDSDCGEKTDD